jgi:hypothetical protein
MCRGGGLECGLVGIWVGKGKRYLFFSNIGCFATPMLVGQDLVAGGRLRSDCLSLRHEIHTRV